MNAIRDYFENHMQHIKLEDGTVVIVTKEGRSVSDVVPEVPQVEEGEEPQPAPEKPKEFTYIDRSKNVKFTFNPLTMEARVESNEAYAEEEYQVAENFFNLK
jgi:hypothetical protein